MYLAAQPCRRCVALSEELDLLREENRQLRDAMAPEKVMHAPFGVHLTPAEWKVFAHLVTRELATREGIHLAICAGKPDPWPQPKHVDVYLSKLRRKLGPFGVEIETFSSRGYHMRNRRRFLVGEAA